MNEVNARRARLQLGWVTVFGRYTISVCNQPTRSTQPCIPQGSLNRVPASAGVRAGVIPYGTCVPVAVRQVSCELSYIRILYLLYFTFRPFLSFPTVFAHSLISLLTLLLPLAFLLPVNTSRLSVRYATPSAQ